MSLHPVDYELHGTRFQGRLVIPDGASGPWPGIVMAPNWMGVTDQAVERAVLLAAFGYVVLVADVYGSGQRPADFSEAAPLADALRAAPLVVRQRMWRALDVLGEEGARRGVLVPGLRAAVGFCFGGGNVLELARAGAPIQAAVSLHGDLTSEAPARPGEVQAAILALHGADDPVVPKAHRDAFEQEMTACGAHWQLHVFGRVLHAFTDVGVDAPPVARHDEHAAARSYEMTHRFITDAFAGLR